MLAGVHVYHLSCACQLTRQHNVAKLLGKVKMLIQNACITHEHENKAKTMQQ